MEQFNQNPFLAEENTSVDIKKELLQYLQFWPWFLICLFISIGSAYFYLRYASPVYDTTAKIKILDEEGGLELPTAGFVFNRSNINLENELEILKSYVILEKVVNNLNLTSQFYKIGRVQTSQIHELPFDYESLINTDSLKKTLSFSVAVEKNQFRVINTQNEKITLIANHDSFDKQHDLPFEIKITPENDLKKSINKVFQINFVSTKKIVLNLKKSIKISPIGDNSDLLQLVLEGESFKSSEAILNNLMEVFNEDGISDRQLVSERTINFIDDRFNFLAKELDSIEINYQGFKEKNNIVDIISDASIGQEQRSVTELKLFELENQLELVELLKNSLNDDSENRLLPADIGLENQGVNKLISEYNLAVMQRDKLSNTAGENNPSLKFIVNSVVELKTNITKSLNNYALKLTTSKQQYRGRALKFIDEVSEMPEKERLLKNIVRQQKIKESLYLLLLQKREEAAINLAVTEPSIKIVEYALTSSLPKSPKKKIVYAGALLAGLLLPFGFLYLMFLLDTKVHTRDDIEKVTTDIPILAEIPEIKKKGSLLFNNPNATSVLAESFRILSANVDYVLPKNDDNSKGKVIFSTSTIKGEGKTFVSLNLSLALASLNKKVLLIGADMRNPQIHTYFGTSKNQLGLSSYLNDASANWKELLMTGFDKHPKHRTMLSGAIPPNPAHLLTNGRFEQLLAETRTEFDYVIVDTAPTILVTDTLLISKFADVTLFLTKANYTDKKLLKFSKELSESGKITNMAYVMNSVGAGKSYGYGYGYNYGYSYGYHEEN